LYNAPRTAENNHAYDSDDLLLTIGNGTSTAARSNALTMYKNGETTVTGNWTGPSFTSTSDARFKENVVTLSGVLAKLEGIRGVSYTWREDIQNPTHQTGEDIGVIAQELNTVFPELVVTDKDGYFSVNYAKMSAILLQAIKEQQVQISAQQTQMDNMQNQINEIVKAMTQE
jgi:hypothetical protein